MISGGCTIRLMVIQTLVTLQPDDTCCMCVMGKKSRIVGVLGVVWVTVRSVLGLGLGVNVISYPWASFFVSGARIMLGTMLGRFSVNYFSG